MRFFDCGGSVPLLQFSQTLSKPAILSFAGVTYPRRPAILRKGAAAIVQIATLGGLPSLEEPMDAIPVSKMPVCSEWHVLQIVKQRFVCSCCEAVKNFPQLVVRSSIDVHSDRISRFRLSLRVQPVRGRKLYAAAFQVSMSNFVVLLGRHVVLHRRIFDFRDRQFAIQARLIKRHSFGAISVEQKKRGEI